VNAKKFYGYGQGQFWTSTDSGATFTASHAIGLPKAGDTVQVKAMPGHEGDVWLAGGSTGNAYGIWHSTDSGATFTQLPNVTGTNMIGFGMAAPGKSYMSLFTSGIIGGVQGLYRSDDAGVSWILINDSQHQFGANTCIAGDPRIFGRVYLGTNGLGIFYGDATGTLPPPTPTPVSTPGATPTPIVTPGVTPTPISTPGATPTPISTPGATPTPTSTPVGGNGVTTTGVVASSSPYFSELDVKFSNKASITALTIKITVQKTAGVTFNGAFTTFNSVTTTHVDNGTTIVYTFTLNAGQTLAPGSNQIAAAQFGGNGTAHSTTGDLWSMTATSGGVSNTSTGHF
jgi:hypothetical protein